MRWLARVALAALGSMTSFFIACAYGVPWRYEKAGRVLDATTQQGISGISVACVDEASVPLHATRTGPAGAFDLGVDACAALVFADVDGDTAGAYLGVTLPFTPADERDIVVELEPAP